MIRLGLGVLLAAMLPFAALAQTGDDANGGIGAGLGLGVENALELDFELLDDAELSDPLALEAPEFVEQKPVAIAATSVPSGVLRGLDRLSGKVEDIPVSAGQNVAWGTIEISMKECRYPTENPSGDAFALLEISEQNSDAPFFRAWMAASSPALTALDHPRYDVWVLRCDIPG